MGKKLKIIGKNKKLREHKLSFSFGTSATEKLLSAALKDYPPMEEEIENIGEALFQYKGTLCVNTKDAIAKYTDRWYIENIKVEIHMREFFLIIDWHDALGIPRKACAEVDVCGSTTKTCWDFNLGKWILPIPGIHGESFYANFGTMIQALRFGEEFIGDDGKGKYPLEGNFGKLYPAGKLITEFLIKWIQNIENGIKNNIEQELNKKLGNGEIAKFIKWFLLNVLKITDIALDACLKIIGITWEDFLKDLFNMLEDVIEQRFGPINRWDEVSVISSELELAPEEKEFYKKDTDPYVHKRVALKIIDPVVTIYMRINKTT